MNNETPLTLAEVLEREAKIGIEKGLAINAALQSGDVNQIYQAQAYLKQIEKREVIDTKSLLVDPLAISASFGFRDKPFNLSYDVLRAMAKTHIVKAIIETRKEQVLSYCEPQKDKYSTGFVIQKRERYADISADSKKKNAVSKIDAKKIEWLIEFLLSCGTTENFWHSDTFDVFISKIVTDALTLDQATFEVVRNKKGEPIEFFATDAATYRIADTYNDDERSTKHPEKIVNGYAPSYVQLYQGNVVAEFYPWELCFGIRNPQTSILNNGYGKAELEDMVQTITSLLNSDSYNASFFKVGSAPKGIIKYSGNINQNTVDDFRRQWNAQVQGVLNMHKTPIINADKMDYIPTHVPNKDMEFSQYQEFLIKITCAQYKIDPSEIGFSMSGNADGQSGLGGDNQEEKVKYSKDKGLRPLLKKIEYWINKYIIWQLDSEFELKFVGLDVEGDEQSELDRDVTMLQNFMTFNEIRAKRDLDPLEDGDVPANPVYVQMLQMKQQEQQMQQQQSGGEAGDGEEDDQDYENNDPYGGDSEEGSNDQDNGDPFSKSLTEAINLLLK